MTDAEKTKAAADAKAASDEAARKAALKAKKQDDAANDDADSEEEGQEDPGEKLGWTAEQKAYVEGLRKESAKHRSKAKELESKVAATNERLSKFEGGLKKLFGEEDQDLPPEKKIEKLSEQNEQLALQTALKDAAIEHGVGKSDYDYFEYLVSKKLQSLKESEELSEEDLAALAKQAKAKSAAKTTSVDGAGPSPDEDDGELSLDDFMEMGIGARSALYQKDKGLYEKLVDAEKTAKKKK